MQHKPAYSLFFTPFLSLLFVIISAAAVDSPLPSSSPSSACNSTLYPKLCRTILSSIRSSPSDNDPYGFGKFSVKQCLKRARKMSTAFGRYSLRLRDSDAGGAVEDCRQLFGLNVEFLESVAEDLRSVRRGDESSQMIAAGELVERVQTRLSAVVTNQQTCYDGLVEAKSGVMWLRVNDTAEAGRMYSVSLALVTQALAHAKHGRRRMKKERSGDPIPRREPLAELIKDLQKKSINSSNPRGDRILSEEMRGNGIMIRESVVVKKDGTGNFTTIGDAIKVAPNNTRPENGYFVIYVTRGVYEEYIVIRSHKRNLLLIGDGINATVISGNHSVVDGWTTYNSSTFAVAGDRFIAIDITFRNTAGPAKHQAVAVRNQADLSTFYRCSFEGYQDTLYAHSLRQFYRDCHVTGTIDFIFGNAAAVFQGCKILPRRPLPHQRNAIAAHGRTDPNQNTGFSLHNCTVDASPELISGGEVNSTDVMTYLGRPWKRYARTVYMQSYIGGLVTPVGWLEWNGTVGLDTLYYGEYRNYGPGADTSKRVRWPGFSVMIASEALNFTVYNFTMGETWLPYTDIPFSGGLLAY